MKTTFLIIILGWLACQSPAQNSISIEAGFLGTYTSIAEYPSIGRTDFLLDSMKLFQNVGSFHAALSANIELGKKFFLSTGFHYSRKGLKEVDYTDTDGYIWYTSAQQHYLGLSVLVGYKFRLKNSRFGFQFATGTQADFAIGTPNGGALFSGSYHRFFMPFSRFNEVDLSWVAEGGCSYKLGPGDVIVKLTYHYGLSDVLEDPFVIGRSMSYGISAGYSFNLR
ncbi:MAG: outer membrane beta-barrel protein [Bacteroidetes bacterium]|nr:outer membrane beta-barrel protein [Bacteroidota bacterium]